jgi:hypothetical protein
MTEPSAAEFARFVQEAKEQRARADALAVALVELRGALQQVYDYGELASRAYHLKYPGDARNRTQIIGPILAADEPVIAGAELLAAADAMMHWLSKYRGVIAVHAQQYGDAEGSLIGPTLAAYRRARAGRGVAEGPGREGE